jgi:hypothetical protein
MAAKSIHLLEMEKHFLYLPLYFAKSQRFFGYLPKDIQVEIDPCDDHTDKSTYAQMMSDSSDYRDIVMAITDPIQVFNTPLTAKRKPAILATLVTNSGFWAINHGTHGKIEGFRGLGKFDRVVAYGPGTTSYDIAMRVVHDSGKRVSPSEFIDVVAPGMELSHFSTLTPDQNAFALSPNVLRIEDMYQDGKVKIELPLGITPEYNDVLVTALVTYNEYATRNPEIIQGVVMGIQKALLMTRRESPGVIQFAQNHFYFAQRSAGAIRMAIEAGVFPPDVKVAKSHWKQAAKAFYEAKHTDTPWTTAEEQIMEDYYGECIQPYEHIAERAIKRVSVVTTIEEEDTVKGKPRRQNAYWNVIAPFTVALMGIIATNYIDRSAVIILLIVSLSAWGITRMVKHVDYVKYVFWISLILGVLITPLPWLISHLHEKLEIILPIGIGFFVAALTTGIEYAKSLKE